jgi:hypothetical protein
MCDLRYAPISCLVYTADSWHGFLSLQETTGVVMTTDCFCVGKKRKGQGTMRLPNLLIGDSIPYFNLYTTFRLCLLFATLLYISSFSSSFISVRQKEYNALLLLLARSCLDAAIAYSRLTFF